MIPVARPGANISGTLSNVGRVLSVAAANTYGESKIVDGVTASKLLTLAAADTYTLTVPATGTAALLATANAFTERQLITSATAIGTPAATAVAISNGMVFSGSADAAAIKTAGGITSTVATGTAPVTVTSTTACPNLNASLLLGQNWASPGAIGGTTPSAISCTTLHATSVYGLALGGIADVPRIQHNSGTFGFYTASNQIGALDIGNITATGSVSCTMLTATGTGGVGYATGAGGAVTQATGRTTGVELNKTCGAITLVSAAGATAPFSFTVTNSTVAATDTVKVCQKSGTDKYVVLITAVAAGSFEITAYTTGGTTTEQPVFSFAVIKAVAA